MNNIDGVTAALLADLDHTDKRKIRAAVDALVPLAAESAELRTILDRLLRDSGRKNHWSAAYVLGQLAQPNDAVIEALVRSLDHPDADIRWAIGLLLVRLAKSDGSLVDRLGEVCRTSSPSGKRMALYCLRDLCLSDADSLAPMLNALHDHDPTVRVAAAICLKTRADVDYTGREQLLRCFVDDPDVRVRSAVATTLAHLAPAAEEIIAALEKASRGHDSQLKKAAARALAILKNKRSAPSGG
jgi:HEAT repeat protein